MFFNEPIFIKQSPNKVSQHVLYRIVFRSEGKFINYEQTVYFFFSIHALKYRMASTAPISINVILAERRFVKVFCTQFTEIHQKICNAQVDIYWPLSVKYSLHWELFTKRWLPWYRFSTELEYQISWKEDKLIFVWNWVTDGQTDGRMLFANKWLILDFVKIAWKGKMYWELVRFTVCRDTQR